MGVQVAAYDRTRPLIIDPVLVYSTYLGGSGTDIARGIAADPVTPGIVYVAGETTSTNFPTTAGFQPTFGKGTDCFVASFNTSQSGPFSRIYSTYLGGSGADQCYGIAVDGSHNAYVVGRTTSTNFPLAKKLNGNNRGGSDAIVVKLNANGSGLLYSVYLGGSADEWGFGIAVDTLGQAYVTGRTTSSNFPVVGGFQSTLGDPTGDAFITKINAAGDAFLYSTYLGGNGSDQGNGIAVGPSAIAYVTGNTTSSNLVTKNAFQAAGGNGDAFVAKVNTTASGGASLLYSSYLGGNGVDAGLGIATDGISAFVTGQTASSFSFLSPSPRFFGSQVPASLNAFVARVDTDQTGQASVAFFGYLGGGSGNAIAVDAIGDAYVTGQTFGGFPVTPDAFQPNHAGNGDAFVARLNTDVSGNAALVFGSYLGGTGADQGLGIALDPSGDGYVTGSTSSTNFPDAWRLPDGERQWHVGRLRRQDHGHREDGRSFDHQDRPCLREYIEHVHLHAERQQCRPERGLRRQREGHPAERSDAGERHRDRLELQRDPTVTCTMASLAVAPPPASPSPSRHRPQLPRLATQPR